MPPGANAITYSYDDVTGLGATVTRGIAYTTSTTDGFGAVVGTLDQAAVKTRTTRDACGRVTFTSTPYTSGTGTVGATTEYDALGRVTRITSATGDVTVYGYNGVDVWRTDGEGRVTMFDYMAFGGPGDQRLVAVTDASSTATQYEYDTLNNLTKVTGPSSGLVRTWAERGPGQISSSTQPESGTTTYTRDAAGNITQQTDATGAITTFAYDENNRLVSRDAPGTVDDLSIAYAAASGLVTSLTGGGAVTTYTYDAAGRIATRADAIGGQSYASSYTYDGNDNLTAVQYPSGRQVTYEYSNDRLTTVRQNTAVFASGFIYDDAGRPSGYTTGAVTHSVTFDPDGRTARIVSSSAAGALDLTYGYDRAGNVKTIADPRPNASQSFGLDVLNRLTTATGLWGSLSWTYDAAGNRLSETGAAVTTYTYDAATQRLISTSGARPESFGYDAVGRLTSDAFGTYTYSPLGRLATTTNTGVSASYLYDPAGLRVGKTVNGATTYTIRGASGDTLSEYTAPCGPAVWSRDLIYAGGRLLGAVKAVAQNPTVSMTSATQAVAEGAGSVAVSFTLTTATGAPLTCAVTAAYRTVDATAVAPADYGARTGTLTFPAGTPSGSTQTVTIPITNDALNEGDETFAVDLSSVAGGSIGATGRTTVTIVDDDPLPTLSIGNASVSEGNSGSVSMPFVLTLSAASGRGVSVSYATVNGTAVAGSDFTGASGTLTIPAESTSAVVSVAVLGDLLPEADETFTLQLSNVANAILGTAQGTGTIVNDDVLSVSLTADRTFPSPAGTPVTWTTSVSGGVAPYQYQFYMWDNAVGWRLVQDYGPSSTLTWTPSQTGTYRVEVRVLDQGSTAIYDGYADSPAVSITAAPAVTVSSFTANTSFPVPAGTSVTWTATASGGVGPLQYKFAADDPIEGWSILRDYGAANTVTWTPARPGSHTLQVWVRAAGSSAQYDAWLGSGWLDVTAVAPRGVSMTSDRALPVAPGTPITWTATAAGGTTPLEYRFVLYHQSTGMWTVEQEYSAARAWTWTPTVADNHYVQVWIRAVGSPNAWDAWLGTELLTIASGPVQSLSLTVNQVAPLVTGTPITWTAQATGGTAPLQYRFVMYDRTSGTWTAVQEWSASRTCTWTPTRSDFGVHLLQVWVRSAGSTVDYEAWASSGWLAIFP